MVGREGATGPLAQEDQQQPGRPARPPCQFRLLGRAVRPAVARPRRRAAAWRRVPRLRTEWRTQEPTAHLAKGRNENGSWRQFNSTALWREVRNYKDMENAFDPKHMDS